MAAVISKKTAALSFPASELVTKPPTIPPKEPPTAMNPKSRLPCSGLNMSAINDQNIVVAKRLKTLTQIKKIGARIERSCRTGIARIRRKKMKRFTIAKR